MTQHDRTEVAPSREETVWAPARGSAIESERRAEILACPFCGSEIGPISVGRAGYGAGNWRWKINCDTCGTSGPMAETVEAARNLWNRRAETAKSLSAKLCEPTGGERVA